MLLHASTAASEHKYIVLNFSGSDWCGPCIKMHKEIFESDVFSKFADENRAMVNADFPRQKKNQLPAAQQNLNDALADRYNNTVSFPLTLLLRGEFSAKAQVFLDQVSQVLPTELISTVADTSSASGDREHSRYPTSARNTFDLSLSYSQIINKRLQVMLIGDVVAQNGLLSLPFHRVYLTNGTVHQENLPSSRIKIPLGLRANYFLGDNIIIRAYYRYYTDDWGLSVHTASLEVPVKITPFISVSPFFRFYDQTGTKYFAPYEKHTVAEIYYTSNYDLSTFNSNFFGAGFRFTPPKAVFGLEHFNMLEIRYGHYQKNIGMNSNVISVNLKFK